MTSDSNELMERLQQDLRALADANRELAARLDAEVLRSRTRLRVAAALAVVVLLSILTSRATRDPRGQKVVTRQLVLTDDAGRRRGSLHMTDDEEPCLQFYGRNNEVVMELIGRSDGFAGMRLYDAEENNRLNVGRMANGDAGMAVYDGAKHLLLDIPWSLHGVNSLLKFPPPGIPGVDKTEHF